MHQWFRAAGSALVVIGILIGSRVGVSAQTAPAPRAPGSVDREYKLEALMVGFRGMEGAVEGIRNPTLTALTGETVRLARALDVDPERFFETIAGGPLDAGYAQLKGRAMLERSYPTSFSVSNVAKDVRLMLEAAGAADVELALAPAMLARFEAAERAGHGADDMAAVVEG